MFLSQTTFQKRLGDVLRDEEFRARFCEPDAPEARPLRRIAPETRHGEVDLGCDGGCKVGPSLRREALLHGDTDGGFDTGAPPTRLGRESAHGTLHSKVDLGCESGRIVGPSIRREVISHGGTGGVSVQRVAHRIQGPYLRQTSPPSPSSPARRQKGVRTRRV